MIDESAPCAPKATPVDLPAKILDRLAAHQPEVSDASMLTEIAERRNQTKTYLKYLDPEAKEFTFFTIHEDKAFTGDRQRFTRRGSLEKLRSTLELLNKRGHGIFVCINETAGESRLTEDILRARAVWIDHDNPGQPEIPTPLTPQIHVTTSPGKSQRLFTTSTMDLPTFDAVQRRLVVDYGSDPGAADRARCLRVPGFYHMKYPDTPHLVTAQFSSSPEPYDSETITAHFPPLAKSTPASTPGTTGQDPRHPARLIPPTFDLARAASALSRIDPDCDYDTWLKIGMALHSTDQEDALTLWDTWSARGSKYRPGETRTKWESFSQTPGGISLGTLIHIARTDYGWTPEDGVADTQQLMLERLIYVAEPDSFYDVTSGATYTATALNRLFAHLQRKTGQPSASKWLLAQHQAIKVDNLTYFPGKRAGVMRYQDKVCWNLWRPTKATYVANVTDADIAPYLDLAETLIPDPQARAHLLDTLAFVVQHPEVKVNHAILLCGSTGIGKDTLFQPLIHALGPHNVQQPSAQEMQEKYTDAYLTAKVVIYQEVQNFEKTEIENKLKNLIAAPPDEIRLRLFGKGFVTVPNRVFMILMSNHRNALKISPDDRRYFAYWSPATSMGKDEAKAYFGPLYAWLDDQGYDLVYSWFKDRDVTAYNPKGIAPMTDFKSEVIGMGLTDPEARIEDFRASLADNPDRDLYSFGDIKTAMGYHFGEHEVGKPADQRLRTLLLNAGFKNRSVRIQTSTGRNREELWITANGARYMSMSEAQLAKTYLGQKDPPAAPVATKTKARQINSMRGRRQVGGRR